MPTHTQSQSATQQGGKGRGKPADSPQNSREANVIAAKEAADENWDSEQVNAPSPPTTGGEADGRARGREEGGGVPLNTPLEDGQLRGVDEDNQPITGTHGGPKDRDKIKNSERVERANVQEGGASSSTANRGTAGGQGGAG